MDNQKPQAKTAVLEITPELRRKGLINSAILAFQFGLISFLGFKLGSNAMAAVCLLSTILAINDTLTFYYANKEK